MSSGRPEILDRFPASGHVVVEASAGTGKTYTLEHLIVHLLATGQAKLPQILVVTFTERAARELSQRTRATIRREESSDALRRDPSARARLAQALAGFDAAAISTIHAFGQRLLAEQAFANHRLFQQAVVDARALFSRSARDVLRRALAEPELGALVETVLRSERLESLESFLFACSSQKGEILPRVNLALRDEALCTLPDRAKVRGEITALARGRAVSPQTLKKVEEHLQTLYLALGPTKDPRGFREWADEKVTLDKRNGRRKDRVVDFLCQLAGLATLESGPLGRVFSPGRSRALSTFANGLERADACDAPPRAQLVEALLPRIREDLEARKADEGVIDFDDMLEQVAAVISGPLREVLRDRFTHVLIDEFQDTDDTQWSVFRGAFFDPPQRLILVGDPRQAIYGFRNADVFTYRRAVDEVVAAGGTVLPLVVNHRSTPELVEVVDRIVGREFFTGANKSPAPARAALGESFLVRTSDVSNPTSLRAEPLVALDVPPEASAGALLESLGSFIADEVRQITAGSLVYQKRGAGPRRLRFRDVQILTRTQAEGEIIAGALSADGVPFTFYRPDGLLGTPEALDVLTLLEAIESPGDRSKLARAWLTPFFDVPLSALAAFVASEEADRAELLRALHVVAERRAYARLFDRVLSETGIERRLLFANPHGVELRRYRQLFELLLSESREGALALDALLRRFEDLRAGRATSTEAEGRAGSEGSELDAVRILTIHKAKGLEAPVVFIAGGFTRKEQDELPAIAHLGGRRHVVVAEPKGSIAEAIQAEWVEEAERLAYVALTRAEARVYLAIPPETPAFTGPSSILAARVKRLLGNGELSARRGDELPGLPNDVLRVALVNKGALRVDAIHSTHGARGAKLTGESARDLLNLAKPRPFDASVLRRVRARTSFTRLTRFEDPERSESTEAPEPNPDARVIVTSAEPELRGGRDVGILMHSFLEHLDFEPVRASVDREDWLLLPSTRSLIESAARRNRKSTELVGAVAKLVFDALRAPLELGDLRLDRGLCAIARRVAEVDLAFPIPERGERLGDHGSRPLRGTVVGSIDLLFEHDARVFLLDWKSDRLPSYEPDRLRERFEASYALQAKIYAIAAARALRSYSPAELSRRFGGTLYAFVRGMAQPGRGVIRWSPSVTDLEAALEDLALHPSLRGRG
ncbi:MAG: UvrD-helicase domain-containing protein [Deltaproteobacteria bacterium]|nr:UvrD-helicase domain-containing protein [Deltaproteobacteria bacterium]